MVLAGLRDLSVGNIRGVQLGKRTYFGANTALNTLLSVPTSDIQLFG
jgi:hypothetical protein